MTPFLTRQHRRRIAVSALALIAFTHAALAVSGCLSNAMPASEAGCEEHQQAASNELAVSNGLLCRTHLQAETQTLDIFKLPQLPSFSMPALVLAPVRRFVPVEFGIMLAARVPVAGAPPPPLNVLYSRFLI
ncbi:MAG TPA: hypothetical protein VFK92_12725 [Burkholderiales bacterium]|nr:hypothetical protein [Burkholderiales bacterium]